MLARVLPRFKMGAGVVVGTGRQWMSWISLATRRLLSNTRFTGRGSFRAVTSHCATGTQRRIHAHPGKDTGPPTRFHSRLRGKVAFRGNGRRIATGGPEACRRTARLWLPFRHSDLESALRWHWLTEAPAYAGVRRLFMQNVAIRARDNGKLSSHLTREDRPICERAVPIGRGTGRTCSSKSRRPPNRWRTLGRIAAVDRAAVQQDLANPSSIRTGTASRHRSVVDPTSPARAPGLPGVPGCWRVGVTTRSPPSRLTLRSSQAGQHQFARQCSAMRTT